MSFRIQGLEPALFGSVIGQSSEVLLRAGAERHVVTDKPGSPCRVSLEDAEIGETVLLVSHQHQGAMTPYRQSGPIFVRERPVERFDAVDTVPPALAIRLLSLRAYDSVGVMINADVIEGGDLRAAVDRLFGDAAVLEVHAHYAKRGCFAARLTRV